MNRYPYHRYLRFLVLEGDSVDEITEHIASLGFSEPEAADVQFLIDTLRSGRIVDDDWRKHCDVTIFEEENDDMNAAHWLVETAQARDVVCQMLLDRVACKHCAQVITIRFGQKITEHAVSLFKQGWWDTDTLSMIDFADYYRSYGKRKPEPPPEGVPLTMRAAYRAWEQGIIPADDELTTEDMIRTLQVDAFMNYAKAKATDTADAQDQARKWAALLMRVSSVRTPKKSAKDDKGAGTLPGLKAAVYYPQKRTPTLADISEGREEASDDGDSDADSNDNEEDPI